MKAETSEAIREELEMYEELKMLREAKSKEANS